MPPRGRRLFSLFLGESVVLALYPRGHTDLGGPVSPKPWTPCRGSASGGSRGPRGHSGTGGASGGDRVIDNRSAESPGSENPRYVTRNSAHAERSAKQGKRRRSGGSGAAVPDTRRPKQRGGVCRGAASTHQPTARTTIETRKREGHQQRGRGAKEPECGCSRRDEHRKHSAPLGISDATPARQNMEEAEASDKPGQVSARTANWGDITREARKRWKQRQKKKQKRP